MPPFVAVNVPACAASNAPLRTTTLVLLHEDGHFLLLERTLRDFLHLERQLQLEAHATSVARAAVGVSCAASIEAFVEDKTSLYPSNQLGVRLAIALETFVRQLTSNAELLTTSLALKTFLHGNYFTRHETGGQSYRDAVEAALRDHEEDSALVEETVGAGCVVEHAVTINESAADPLVLWKFASRGMGLAFCAHFSSRELEEKDTTKLDPYSLHTHESVRNETDESDVIYYKTSCTFATSTDFMYGHYVPNTSGVVTLEWENGDMSSVVSKRLQFQVTVVPSSRAKQVLDVVDALQAVESAEWLHHHILASTSTCVDDLVGWKTDEWVGHEASTYDEYETRMLDANAQSPSARLAERNQELEAQVTHLEKRLAATQKELQSALDRVAIADEICKANLETITQLECTPKASKVARERNEVPVSSTATVHGTSVPKERHDTLSTALKRMQKLCAGFQEQCLWRSVENMELEAQVAASKMETCVWRDRHVKQTAQVEALTKQNQTLRLHKKMLVQEVKRLQPYSHINVAALVQEAQEARMVQRSLQAKLDSHEGQSTRAIDDADAASSPTDFVLVEALEKEAT
ncbi:hypothetical protein PsorP6_015959 [Peronosclerospora sorghi]|uniref:Uncharacterized protein n=1 Tax=Peronosclerospora sorghi TaxID=230839 RepID=A0ACC0WMR7_9STRA|nr:hypothetical protein PsorP6_015959 [Peronosclerospora sorghi]